MKKNVLLFITVLILGVLPTALFAGPLLLIGYPSQSPAVDTLRSAMFYPGNIERTFWEKQFYMRSNFYKKGFVNSIPIFENKPEMQYKLWLQEKNAPIVYIIPGLGTHYTGVTVTAFAEIFYLKGYSVVVISSVFNWEFNQSASTVLTPGYTIQDSEDIYNALFMINNKLNREYPERISEKYLVGYSLGGLETLYIADIESKITDGNKIGFKRYLALNPPVDLLYAMNKIDGFYGNSSSWTPNQISKKLTKAGKVFNNFKNNKLNSSDDLPFTSEEAQYVIGLTFHLTLSELIFSICQQDNLGIINTDYSWFSRDDVYKEIDAYNYFSYLNIFLKKYYKTKFGIDFNLEEFSNSSGLKFISDTLKNNSSVRIIHTADDFTVSDNDMNWLESTMSYKMILINHGGHLGYLFYDKMADVITSSLTEESFAKYHDSELKN